MDWRGVIALFREEPSWYHQLIRLLAETKDGGGDLFEILDTASKIRVKDEDDWYRKWFGLASSTLEKGRQAEKAGKVATARAYYLNATNYFRMADFYLDPDDKRDMETYDLLVTSFQSAAKYFDHEFELVEVPFEGVSMPGYFMRTKGMGRRPVVILMGGADSVKEEYYFRGARECLERGMSCLLIDGPGQGAPLRKHKMYIRHDYEKPVGAILDYLTSRSDVDPARIGYVAASLGGYFAVRAAAFERRIAAVVAWSAVYDVLEDVYDFFPPIGRRIRNILGVNDDREARERLRMFNLKGVVGKVKCPLLVIHGEEDYITSVQGARRVYREARCDKTLKIYRKGELGATHAQQDRLGETTAFLFDWMVEKLGHMRTQSI